jgi:hypothetical protein
MGEPWSAAERQLYQMWGKGVLARSGLSGIVSVWKAVMYNS